MRVLKDAPSQTAEKGKDNICTVFQQAVDGDDRLLKHKLGFLGGDGQRRNDYLP